MQRPSRRQRSVAQPAQRPRNRPEIMVTDPVPPPYSFRPLFHDVSNPPRYSAINANCTNDRGQSGHVSDSGILNDNNNDINQDSIIVSVEATDNILDSGQGHLNRARSPENTWYAILPPPEGDGPPPYDNLSVVEENESQAGLISSTVETQAETHVHSYNIVPRSTDSVVPAAENDILYPAPSGSTAESIT